MPNLPVIRPGAPVGKPSTPGRAQQFNKTILNQQKDQDAATTSISGAIAKKNADTGAGRATTSVFHQGDDTAPSTSIAHPGAPRNADIADDDAVRDRLRYQYIRKLMREKKAAEAAEAQAQAANNSGLQIKTGSAYKLSGKGGLRAKIGKEMREHKAAYSNLSGSEKKQLESILHGTLKQKSTGSSVSRQNKLSMKQQVEDAYKKGNISSGAKSQFKGIIDKLT